MSVTSGRMSRTPLAFYDPDSSSWRTSQITFDWDSTPSSPTLPRWGMTRRGVMYELATPALPTFAGASLSLLPTPEAKLSSSGPDYARATRPGSGGDDLTTTIHKLFPTPRATDGTKGGPNQRGSSGDLMMPSVAARLLPTPTAQAAKHAADDRGPGTLDDFNLWSVAARMMPTPSVADAMGGHLPRGGKRSNELLLPGVAKSIGASTKPPDDAGKPSSGDQHPAQLSLEDEADAV